MLNSNSASPCYAEPRTAIHNRSAGFWAYDEDDNLGVVTSPHTTITNGMSIAVSGSPFGVASTPYCGGTVDAVFVRRTASSFTPTRFVSGWEFNLTSAATISLMENSYIYAKGINSGCIIGTVEDNHYDFSWTQNDQTCEFEECVLTTAVARVGDSGGIVAGGGTSTSRYVAGIIIAIDSESTSGPMIYCKAPNIVSTLGVSVY